MVASGRRELLLLLGVPEYVHEGALVAGELGATAVLKRGVIVLVEAVLGLVAGRRGGIESRYAETVVGFGEGVKGLCIHLGGGRLLARHVHRGEVLAGPGQLLLFIEVLHEQVVLGPHGVTRGRLLSTKSEPWGLLVIGGAWLALLLLLEDLVHVELLHRVARDSEAVLLGLGEAVSLVVDVTRPVDFLGAPIARPIEAFLAGVESLSSVGALLLAELAFQLVAKSLGVALGHDKALTLAEGELLLA